MHAHLWKLSSNLDIKTAGQAHCDMLIWILPLQAASKFLATVAAMKQCVNCWLTVSQHIPQALAVTGCECQCWSADEMTLIKVTDVDGHVGFTLEDGMYYYPQSAVCRVSNA